MNTARELSDRLASLYRNERTAMADFLIALSTFDERKAWREIGYPSLWSYLRHELKLSKSAAFHRKTAAELIQAHPAVADALRSGQLCLSTVAELARVLTPENAREVAAGLAPPARDRTSVIGQREARRRGVTPARDRAARRCPSPTVYPSWPPRVLDGVTQLSVFARTGVRRPRFEHGTRAEGARGRRGRSRGPSPLRGSRAFGEARRARETLRA